MLYHHNQSSQNILLKLKLRVISFQNVYFERLTLPTLINHPNRVSLIMLQKNSIPDDELITGESPRPVVWPTMISRIHYNHINLHVVEISRIYLSTDRWISKKDRTSKPVGRWTSRPHLGPNISCWTVRDYGLLRFLLVRINPWLWNVKLVSLIPE